MSTIGNNDATNQLVGFKARPAGTEKYVTYRHGAFPFQRYQLDQGTKSHQRHVAVGRRNRRADISGQCRHGADGRRADFCNRVPQCVERRTQRRTQDIGVNDTTPDNGIPCSPPHSAQAADISDVDHGLGPYAVEGNLLHNVRAPVYDHGSATVFSKETQGVLKAVGCEKAGCAHRSPP